MQTINIQIDDSFLPLFGKKDGVPSLEVFREQMQAFSQIFLWLSESEQEELIKAVHKRVMISHALRRNPASVLKPFTMEEIVEEVLAVRSSIIPKEKKWSAHPPIKKRQAGTLKGLVKYMADDFDAPMEDFKDYM